MQKGQTSRRAGIQDFLMPVTDFYGTQGSNTGSHAGTMANDIRGIEPGVKYPYYAPCDCKLIWRDVSNGQGMWQSLEKVRFSNGNISFATFVTAHDNTFDAQIGQIVRQGEQLGNMGDQAGGGAYVTGVHVHIEVAQHQYDISNWQKNGYGIYCFPNETDTDDCFFIDNTNMINGLGGNWRTTNQVPVEEPPIPPEPTGADQILYKGSKVKFDGVFKVDILKSPLSSNLFGCCQLTGCSLNDYKNENVKPYHWLPAEPFTECDSNGNATSDQVLSGGNSWAKNDNVYNVEDIDIPSNSAKLVINGREVWVFSKYLYEVSDR